MAKTTVTQEFVLGALFRPEELLQRGSERKIKKFGAVWDSWELLHPSALPGYVYKKKLIS